jgi:hypothetical protein
MALLPCYLLEQARVTGLEPAINSAANDNGCCVYVNCQECCAAKALHPQFFKCLETALNDAHLQTVMFHRSESFRYAGLPNAIDIDDRAGHLCCGPFAEPCKCPHAGIEPRSRITQAAATE